MCNINKALFARMKAYPVRRAGKVLPSVKLNITQMPTQSFDNGTATPNRFDTAFQATAAEGSDIKPGDLITIGDADKEVLEIHKSTSYDEPGVLLVILGVSFD